MLSQLDHTHKRTQAAEELDKFAPHFAIFYLPKEEGDPARYRSTLEGVKDLCELQAAAGRAYLHLCNYAAQTWKHPALDPVILPMD